MHRNLSTVMRNMLRKSPMIAYNWIVIVILQVNSHDEYALGVRLLAHVLIPVARIHILYHNQKLLSKDPDNFEKN